MNNRMPTAFFLTTPAGACIAGPQVVAGYDGIAATITKSAPKNEAALCSTGIRQYDQVAEALSCKINLEHSNSMHNAADYSKYVVLQALEAR